MDHVNDLQLVARFTGRNSSVHFASINQAKYIKMCEIFVGPKFQSTSSFVEIISPLVLVFWAFILIYFFCELGHMVSNHFDKFNIELGQCHWYSFPKNFQRIFITLMINAQEPVIIQGFGNTVCTRDAFKAVINLTH